MEKYYHSDLSRQIIGIFYDIYNNVGWGYRENFYERLARTKVYESGIKYKDQFTFPLLHNKTIVKCARPDLLIEDRIIVEIKVGKRFFGKDFAQINEYLKVLNLRLGLLILISPDGVIPRRVVNNPGYKLNTKKLAQ